MISRHIYNGDLDARSVQAHYFSERMDDQMTGQEAYEYLCEASSARKVAKEAIGYGAAAAGGADVFGGGNASLRAALNHHDYKKAKANGATEEEELDTIKKTGKEALKKEFKEGVKDGATFGVATNALRRMH